MLHVLALALVLNPLPVRENLETKTETKTEAKPEAKPETKPEAKAEAKGMCRVADGSPLALVVVVGLLGLRRRR